MYTREDLADAWSQGFNRGITYIYDWNAAHEEGLAAPKPDNPYLDGGE